MCLGLNNRPSHVVKGMIWLMLVSMASFSWQPRLPAQLVPDPTLGTEAAIVNAGATVQGAPAVLIQGGAIRGVNLFHSFADFNVGNAQRVYFADPTGVDTIFARVTGGNPSSILGTLGVDGNASLFLINPAGVVFGANARLDVKGAFLASTASRFTFPDGSEFSATNPQAPPMLTIKVTPGLQYGSGMPGTIATQGFLEVGGSLTLAADTLDLGGKLRSGGDLTLEANQTIVATANISTVNNSPGLGQGGDIILQAPTITLNGAQIITQTNQMGGGGNIYLTAEDQLQLTNNAQIQVESLGPGNTGNIQIVAGQMEVVNSLIAVDARDSGNGGLLDIITPQLTVRDGAKITATANPAATGVGGSILIQANQVSASGNSSTGIFAGTLGAGEAGDLTIQPMAGQTALTIDLRDHAQISVTTAGSGVGGDLLITAPDSVNVQGQGFLAAETSADGVGGLLRIDTNTLNITGRGGDLKVSATATQAATAEGGRILVRASTINLAGSGGSGLFVGTLGAGDGGDLAIQPQVGQSSVTVNFQDNAKISAETRGSGVGGDLLITAQDAITLLGQGLISGEAQASGAGGTLLLQANTVNVGEVKVSASAIATATGEAGSLVISANTLNLSGSIQGGLFAANQGTVAAGDITLQPNTDQPSLTVNFQNNAQISAATSSAGIGGDILITAPESVTLQGQGLLSVETKGPGAGGILQIAAPNVQISGIRLSAETSGSGVGGDILIQGDSLTMTNGAEVFTNTSGSGEAGDITLLLTHQFTLTGVKTGLIAGTNPGSTGDGGSVFVSARSGLIQNGGGITVNSAGSGLGGEISIQVDNLTLAQNASLRAETTSSDGGNLDLQIGNILLMRNASLISATAGGQGNGGNLTIVAGFIVAHPYENSDIIANAFLGEGGDINITSQAVFGLEFRSIPTPLSDITASSRFGIDGTVTLNTPEVDPASGLVQLPTNPIDASNQIAQGCRPGQGQPAGRFVVSGRGGLPPAPTDPFNGDNIWSDLRLHHQPETTTDPSQQPTQPPQSQVTYPENPAQSPYPKSSNMPRQLVLCQH